MTSTNEIACIEYVCRVIERSETERETCNEKKKLNKQRPGEESVGRIIYALKYGLIKFDNELDNRGATFVIVKERIF